MARSNGITVRRTTKPAPRPAPARVRYVKLTGDFEAYGVGNVPPRRVGQPGWRALHTQEQAQ